MRWVLFPSIIHNFMSRIFFFKFQLISDLILCNRTMAGYWFWNNSLKYLCVFIFVTFTIILPSYLRQKLIWRGQLGTWIFTRQQHSHWIQLLTFLLEIENSSITKSSRIPFLVHTKPIKLDFYILWYFSISIFMWIR